MSGSIGQVDGARNGPAPFYGLCHRLRSELEANLQSLRDQREALAASEPERVAAELARVVERLGSEAAALGEVARLAAQIRDQARDQWRGQGGEHPARTLAAVAAELTSFLASVTERVPITLQEVFHSLGCPPCPPVSHPGATVVREPSRLTWGGWTDAEKEARRALEMIRSNVSERATVLAGAAATCASRVLEEQRACQERERPAAEKRALLDRLEEHIRETSYLEREGKRRRCRGSGDSDHWRVERERLEKERAAAAAEVDEYGEHLVRLELLRKNHEALQALARSQQELERAGETAPKPAPEMPRSGDPAPRSSSAAPTDDRGGALASTVPDRRCLKPIAWNGAWRAQRVPLAGDRRENGTSARWPGLRKQSRDDMPQPEPKCDASSTQLVSASEGTRAERDANTAVARIDPEPMRSGSADTDREPAWPPPVVRRSCPSATTVRVARTGGRTWDRFAATVAHRPWTVKLMCTTHLAKSGEGERNEDCYGIAFSRDRGLVRAVCCDGVGTSPGSALAAQLACLELAQGLHHELSPALLAGVVAGLSVCRARVVEEEVSPILEGIGDARIRRGTEKRLLQSVLTTTVIAFEVDLAACTLTLVKIGDGEFRAPDRGLGSGSSRLLTKGVSPRLATPPRFTTWADAAPDAQAFYDRWELAAGDYALASDGLEKLEPNWFAKIAAPHVGSWDIERAIRDRRAHGWREDNVTLVHLRVTSRDREDRR